MGLLGGGAGRCVDRREIEHQGEKGRGRGLIEHKLERKQNCIEKTIKKAF